MVQATETNQSMRVRVLAAMTLLAVALVFPVAAPANPTYTLIISPGVPVNQGSTVTFALSLSSGQRNSAYSVVIGVTKPNGSGEASTSRTILTDNLGSGSTTLNYPDPSFTAINGTVNTDVGGV